MRSKVYLAMLTCSAFVASATMAPAALLNVIVEGTVGANTITQGPFRSALAPTGSAARLTIPVDTSLFWFFAEDEGEEGTVYKLQNQDVKFEAGASGVVNGLPVSPATSSNSYLSFSGGEFSHGFSLPAGFRLNVPSGVPSTNVDFLLHGFSGPNPFNGTRFLEQNLGEYSPLTNPPFSSRQLALFPAGGGLLNVTLTKLTIAQVPEPSSLVLLGVGASGLALRRRQR